MLAAQITAPGSVRVADLPCPSPGPGEVLLRVAACGVCGTDVHIFHGGFRADYPLVPGHEYSGVVVEMGAGAGQLRVGDRVVVDPNLSCGVCPYCRRGLVHLCQSLRALGVNLPGGFAQYCVAPAQQLHRLPDQVSLADAAFAEPLACCVHGVDRAGIELGDSVVLLGAGPIGLLMLQLVRAAGARQVTVIEPVARKRELAGRLGADATLDPGAVAGDLAGAVRELTGIGADVVFECVGRADTATTALSLARRGGKVVLFGVCDQAARLALSPYDVFLNELTVLGSYVNPFTHARAIELLAAGRVQVAPLVSHRFELAQFEQALATASGGQAVKVLVGADLGRD